MSLLGYIVSQERGHADTLIRNAALQLRDEGVNLVGAFQVNLETTPNSKCDMDLHILSGENVVRISQNLGTLSKGCRLDPNGLERAVALVEAGLSDGADLLVINKFGKQEAEGRGFRTVIGNALVEGIPVLTAVPSNNLPAFKNFAEDFGIHISEDIDAILDWCRKAL